MKLRSRCSSAATKNQTFKTLTYLMEGATIKNLPSAVLLRWNPPHHPPPAAIRAYDEREVKVAPIQDRADPLLRHGGDRQSGGCRQGQREWGEQGSPRERQWLRESEGGCGGGFLYIGKEDVGITRRSRDTARRLSPPWTRHISINLLIWQHGPRVNQNSRLLCHKCIFQVYGSIWHP